MDFSQLLKTVCPWIGAAIGGPLGSMAVTLGAEALGISDKTADGIKAAIAGATPESLLALKKADQDFAARMKELGFKSEADLEGIAAGDRANARGMQTSLRSRIPAILSILVTVGFFGLLAGMMTGVLKVTDNQALLIMIGSLASGWGMVMAFWFGTTHDSGRKTEMLAQAEPLK